MSASVRFVLNEPRNPKNIGAAARGMANFGFRELHVVNPYSAAWRELRSAVKAADVVAKARKHASLASALKGAHLVVGTSAGTRRSTDAPWIDLDGLRALVKRHVKAKKKVALLFGSERFGLSNDDLSRCHRILRLPTDPECPSMNLSQAVAVTAFAIRAEALDAAVAPAGPVSAITDGNLERLVERGTAAVVAAGAAKGWDAAQTRQRLRKSFRAWNFTPADAALLHSLFGWVLKRAPAKR